MKTNLDRYRADLEKLLKLSASMLSDIHFKHKQFQKQLTPKERQAADAAEGAFESNYQKWYTESALVIQQLIPSRQSEFEHLYKGDGKRREISPTTFTIQDWLTGMRGTQNQNQYFAAVAMRFKTQIDILEAADQRFESSLFDIKQLIQADLFDSELEAARELAKYGFARGTGAVAGVVLEKHLAQVVTNHKITVQKKHPTISDLNDLLKSNGVVEIPDWRVVQRLGDLRNLCDHNKGRDPTTAEISELIDGVDKIAKTLF